MDKSTNSEIRMAMEIRKASKRGQYVSREDMNFVISIFNRFPE